MKYRIQDDVKAIRQMLNMSQKEFAKTLGIEGLTITRIENGDVYPSEETIEKIYDFASKKNLDLNRIKEEFHKEGVLSSHVVLFFAAKQDLEGKISFDHSRDTNDFGKGFYLYESLEDATAFLSKFPHSSIYIFYFQKKDLNTISYSFNSDWLITVAYHHGLFDNDKNPILTKFLSKLDNMDYVTAPVLDNRMFHLIQQFTEGKITDEQCLQCLNLFQPKTEYVLLQTKAIKNATILERCYVSNHDRKLANAKKNTICSNAYKAIEDTLKKYQGQGKYIGEILK